MRRSYLILLGLAGLLGIAYASTAGCNATAGHSTFGDGGGGSDTSSGMGNSGQGASASSDVGAFVGAGGGGGSGLCGSDPSTDDDNDGFSDAAGDCNDCDPNVSPGSLEVINPDPAAELSDEDCDGTIDNVLPTICDANLALGDTDPYNAARAIDLCQIITPSDKRWGVLNARYVRAEGAPWQSGLQNGILSDFGPNVNPQGGTRLLALSTGRARLPSQTGACGFYSCGGTGPGTPPVGFPQDVPNCPGAQNINDDIGLEVKIRSPKNATGYKFKFKFYSFEYPEWLCKAFNDQFIALAIPAPMGSISGNISFDKLKNPVSVNVAFFDVCDGCPLGPSEMDDTGFNTWNDAGGTGWLQSQAPIKGGDEVKLRFTIWDTEDNEYDSTALVDGFEWIANGGAVTVETEPIPDPK